LDNNYDDPQEIWKVLERIEREANKDSTISASLPPIGLVSAFKKVVERLEESPQRVHLSIPDEGIDDDVVVGADDLRHAFINPWAGTYAEDVESWPKYITEMYNGDYRYLALISMGRTGTSSSLMINTLVNNSLGVSKEREQALDSRPAKRWLGDINAHYTSTRDVCPAPKVASEFRQHVTHDIPILLIQGDMDMSTPYANAPELMNYLDKGHLIRVVRGFHNAKRALILQDSTLAKSIYRFMDLDFESTEFDDFKSSLPTRYELPEFKFWPIEEESLYDQNAKSN